MRTQPLPVIVLLATFTPSLTLAQRQPPPNCHTLESSSNFVGPDETIVDGVVCKVVKTQPDKTQIVAQHSTPAAAPASSASSSGHNQPASVPSSSITNTRIIEMSKLGLDDEIIIAKIKNGSCEFQLEDPDLVQLKKSGVSPKVIAAMLDSSVRPTSQVTTSRSDVPSPVSAESGVGTRSESGPSDPGMYLTAANGFTKILGQIVDFKRSGSMLASDLTLHIKTTKENVQLLGPHAQTVASSSPEFYFIPAKQEADAGVNAGDLILVRLEEKKERRQFEIGAQGAWRASKGISLTHQVQLTRSEARAGVYKIAPAVGLEKGEYGLYLSRGEGMAPYIYDFSVQ